MLTVLRLEAEGLQRVKLGSLGVPSKVSSRSDTRPFRPHHSPSRDSTTDKLKWMEGGI